MFFTPADSLYFATLVGVGVLGTIVGWFLGRRSAQGAKLVPSAPVTQTPASPASADIAPATLAAKVEEMAQIFWLAARDIVVLTSYDCQLQDWSDGWRVAVVCNDTFGYACADAQEMQPSQAAHVRQLYEDFGWTGIVAWCAVQRNEAPLKELQTPTFHHVCAQLKQAVAK